MSASDGITGLELWQSNGQAQGTLLIQDIAPGMANSAPTDFTISGASIFFVADDAQHGRELWTLPLRAVSPSIVPIDGPAVGITQASNTFTASVEPITSTLPVTYVWQATGQSPVTHTGGLNDTVAFAWNNLGAQTITVTASNANGALGTGIHTITITEGAQITISPASGGTLSHIDDQGNTTSIQIPAGAVTQSIDLRYTTATTGAPTTGVGFAGHAFSLNAFRDGFHLDGFSFQKPITITIGYSDSDIAGLNESVLALDYWNGGAWIDAATTCAPASTYQRDLVANQLSGSICHLTAFALFEVARRHVYMPILTR